jgi:VanZ family protein
VWLLLAVVWTGVIFYGSTASAERLCDRALAGVLALVAPAAGPDDGRPPDYFWEKKAIHAALFVTLAFLLSRASVHGAHLSLVLIVVLGTAVGMASEALQFFFPSREPALRDVVINTAAVCAGVAAFHPRFRRSAAAA